jgi:hypothetical protein
MANSAHTFASKFIYIIQNIVDYLLATAWNISIPYTLKVAKTNTLFYDKAFNHDLI